MSVYSRTKFTDLNVAPQSIGTDKSSLPSSEKYEQNALQFEFIDINREPNYSSTFEENVSNYSKIEQTQEQNSSVHVNRTLHGDTSQSDLSSSSHVQLTKEETSICQKPKEMCSSGSNLVAKFKQDPGLLTKFMSNPNLVAKIFQDQKVIMKIMTDPDMVTCLATDPNITQFLEEHDIIDTAVIERERENVKTKIQSREAPENNGSSGDSRYTPKSKGSHIENPILTDLITNRNTEECKSQNLESNTNTDWNKNTADVTRDVLQDVQR